MAKIKITSRAIEGVADKFALAAAGMVAYSVTGNSDAFALVVCACGLVAYGIGFIVERREQARAEELKARIRERLFGYAPKWGVK